ncbi:diketogulonate reductase-like aldo/keto reductase [Kribbella orskensis]|uniref:Diketogulonate reductase-like aldo/keto reductase n=1 Tax=Kribbella orskensis TaxID=2512216 RepID=A0ABY2BNC5_9ACTN|nr:MULTISPECIES: aldo/keto reductase [Kribbella]TCN41771.1 diketogulonate reductase-like aldo/keto reductase [Kribbella sp. VKM Ac-2500]TCO25649.1 diketogulonate reductase-like aldo/keto reductase [Kribbella orskensis]
MTANNPQLTRTLSNGAEIPLLGLGVWQVEDGPETERAVAWALEKGYRLIDTAQAYGNESSVGRAIRSSGIPREEIFLTTKFYPGSRDPRVEAEKSLGRLGTDFLDLYLIHWPKGGPTWAWPGMEAASEAGLTKGIGISNFGASEIQELLKVSEIQPAVNQIQFSPFEYRRALVDACEDAGVVAQAYSPLGTGRHLGDPVVERIASATGRTPAQVLIRWAIQKGLSVIPKSSHRERIDENFNVLDFDLDEESVSALDALDTTGQTPDALSRSGKWW